MSMKMDSIVFRLEVKEGNGFIPFRNDNGEWVHQRDIVLLPFLWQSGSGVSITIEEKYSNVDGIVNPWPRQISKQIFYDKDNSQYKELLDALASNDLRGRTAEMMAHKIYWYLFAFSDEMKKHLPELVAWYEKINNTKI